MCMRIIATACMLLVVEMALSAACGGVALDTCCLDALHTHPHARGKRSSVPFCKLKHWPVLWGVYAGCKYQVHIRGHNALHAQSHAERECSSVQSEALACTLGCLYAGCVYQVRIRARNTSGWGDYSIASDVRAAAGVPHAPTAPRAIGQSAVAIEVAWDAPQHDGGSIVTSYRLEMSTGDSSF